MPVASHIEVEAGEPTKAAPSSNEPRPMPNVAPLIRGGENRKFTTPKPAPATAAAPQPPWMTEDPFVDDLPGFGWVQLSPPTKNMRTNVRRVLRGREIKGKGVLLQSVAMRRLNVADMKLSESMCWIPGVTLDDLRAK